MLADKNSLLCKKQGGPHKSHNSCDCCHFNKDGTPIKKNGGKSKPHFKERKEESVNFTQIVRTELKKALHNKVQKHKKHCKYDSEGDNDLDKSFLSHRSNSTGDYIM